MCSVQSSLPLTCLECRGLGVGLGLLPDGRFVNDSFIGATFFATGTRTREFY